MGSKNKRNRQHGNSMAEMPVALWMFLLFLLVPFMALCSFSYRATVAYFAIRDCTYQAAKQPTFGTMRDKAVAVLGADSAAWTGISIVSQPVVTIVILGDPSPTATTTYPMPENPQTPGTPLTKDQINPKCLYLCRVTGSFLLEPLINNYGAGGLSIPIVSQPIPLNFSYQVFIENPQGLDTV